MAATDNLIPFVFAGGGTITLKDGTGTPETLAIAFKQGTFTYSETGRAYAEAREAGRHASTVTVMETDDSNMSGSFSCLVTSFKGSSNTHPYEFLTWSGTAAGFTSTSAGDKKTMIIIMGLTIGGVNQTLQFNHCVVDSVDIDTGGAEGLCQLSCSFTSLTNAPSIT